MNALELFSKSIYIFVRFFNIIWYSIENVFQMEFPNLFTMNDESFMVYGYWVVQIEFLQQKMVWFYNGKLEKHNLDENKT